MRVTVQPNVNEITTGVGPAVYGTAGKVVGMKPNDDRLPAETITLDIEGYRVTVSLAYVPGTNRLWELVFVQRPGKDGTELNDMFRDLGIQLSRAIQGRDPVTGKEVPP
jgi:hypothetical protein